MTGSREVSQEKRKEELEDCDTATQALMDALQHGLTHYAMSVAVLP